MTGKAEIRFIGEVEAAGDSSTIRLFPDYCEGLLGIESYSHLILLYWLHLKDDEGNRSTLKVRPPRHGGAPLMGVFGTRSPSRPNPIGLSVVKLESVEGCRLVVRGLDALEGSPIVDVKPYSPRSDSVPEARTPEWSTRGPPS